MSLNRFGTANCLSAIAAAAKDRVEVPVVNTGKTVATCLYHDSHALPDDQGGPPERISNAPGGLQARPITSSNQE